MVAIIQARMGSSRLPGKVLMNICGKPMLWHVVTRIRQAKYVDDVVIACTANRHDDALQEFAARNGLGIYRGSENDIVDRILKTAQQFGADTIVRIWADCPLIDPSLVDKLLSRFVNGDYDYANNFNPPTYPVCMSFEVYRLETLERIWNETDDVFYRQYPFEYIYTNGSSFKTMYDRYDENLSAMNLTVDYVEDLELVSEIFRNLGSEKATFNLTDILRFLESHPQLRTTTRTLARNIEYSQDKELRRRHE